MTDLQKLLRHPGSRGGTILQTINFAPPRIAACARDTLKLDTHTLTNAVLTRDRKVPTQHSTHTRPNEPLLRLTPHLAGSEDTDTQNPNSASPPVEEDAGDDE